jgi:CheY-like chemotaxis protein
MPPSPEKACSWSVGRSEYHVLVIDDEAVIRRAMSRYFARLGWVVSEAADGDAAIGILGDVDGEEFDLVICDLRMPRTSGADLYRWMQQRRPQIAARFVFSSGDVLAPEAARFLEGAGRPVLPKPFDLGDLTRIIDEVRGSARAR